MKNCSFGKSKIMIKNKIQVVFSVFILLVAVGNAQIEKMQKKDPLPEFSLLDDSGDYWDSKVAKGKYLVVYFYPAAMTGGCTKQACAYRDRKEIYQTLNTSVVGISGDEVENLSRFKKTYDLNFPLLSDNNGEVSEMFGVTIRKGKKSIKRHFEGFEVVLNRNVTTARWTFVFSPNGELIYKNDEVKAAQDAKIVERIIKQHLKK